MLRISPLLLIFSKSSGNILSEKYTSSASIENTNYSIFNTIISKSISTFNMILLIPSKGLIQINYSINKNYIKINVIG